MSNSTVELLELIEAAPVHNPCNHLPDIVRSLEIGSDDSIELLRVIQRVNSLSTVQFEPLGPVQVSDNLSGFRKRVFVVNRKVICYPRGPAV